MKSKMKNIFAVLILLLFFFESKSQEKQPVEEISKEKIVELRNFLKGKEYNQDVAIFINFKIPSNKFRLFIYDLKKGKVLEILY